MDNQLEQNRFSVQDLWNVLFSQRLVIASFAVSVLLLTMVTTWLSTPMYSSTAVVEVVPRLSHEMKGQGLFSQQPAGTLYLNQQFYRTETDKILSLSSRRRVVERYKEELGYTDLEDNGAEQLKGVLTVSPRSNSRLIDIGAQHSDPVKAAALANLTAEVYRERNLSFRQKSASDAQTWLSEQLEEYKTRIDVSNRALLAFRTQNDLGDVEETRSTLASQFAEYSGGYATISSQRIQLATDVSIYGKLLRNGNYDELGKVVSSKLIDELASQYSQARSEHENVAAVFGEKHVTYKKSQAKMNALENQLKRELNRQLRADKSRLSILVAKEDRLKSQIGTVKGDLLDKQHLLKEHQDLQDQVDHNRKFYDKLIQRLDELKLESRTQLNNANIIDRAEVPKQPFTPRWFLNFLLGCIVGVGGGVLVGLLKEYLDDTVGSPMDIGDYLNIPYLGLIPELRGQMSRGERCMYTLEHPHSTVAEAVRSIRAMLEVQHGAIEKCNLMVTSAAASEGKTATVVWLGIAYAQLGKRVLLVDADLRRPQLHKVFDLPRDHGLTALLTAGEKLQDCARKTAVEGLDVVVAGEFVDHPNELLSSRKMTDLRRIMVDQYDLVIFDTPPISAVSDALVLSQMVDGVAVVVRSKTHTRMLIKHTVERLQQVNAKILGIVLNAVNTDGTTYYKYRYYYTSNEDEESESNSKPSAAK